MKLDLLAQLVLASKGLTQEEDPNFLICRNERPRARKVNPFHEPGVKPIGCCPPNDPDGKLYGPNKACCCDKVYRPEVSFCCQPTGSCDGLTQILPLESAHICEELKLFHNPPKYCPETLEIEGLGEIASCSDDNNFGSTCGMECRKGFTKVDMADLANAGSASNKNKNAIALTPPTYQCNDDGKWNLLDLYRKENECCRPTCPPSLPKTAKADFFIVLDKSSSIKIENFGYVKEFMLKIMDTFPLGPDNVQVRLTTYNNVVERVFELQESATLPLTAINDRINSIAYNGRGTLTGDGLIDVVENALYKPDNRLDADDYLLLVTDGRSKQSKLIKDAVAELEQNNVKILVIGVGDQVRRNELSTIASEPVADNLRIIRDFEALVEMSDWVLSTQCPELTCD